MSNSGAIDGFGNERSAQSENLVQSSSRLISLASRPASFVVIDTGCQAASVLGVDNDFGAPLIQAIGGHVGMRTRVDPWQQGANSGIVFGAVLKMMQPHGTSVRARATQY